MRVCVRASLCVCVSLSLELRDGLTRVSSEVLGSLRNVWQVFSQVPNSALPLLGQGSDAAFNTSSDTQDDSTSPPLSGSFGL